MAIRSAPGLSDRGTRKPLPTVVEFVGYGAGRGLPHERLAWLSAGVAYVVMDRRGQGAGGGPLGATADPHGSAPSVPGFLTRGITDIESFYYRRLITDAVRCLDVVRELPGVDGERIAVAGTSQGGGIALAVAGLRDEIARYLAAHRGDEDRAFETLSHADGIHFAPSASAPALFSTGLHDATCPPSTVFSAYNRYGAEEEDIAVFPYNDHEGGGAARWTYLAQWWVSKLREM